MDCWAEIVLTYLALPLLPLAMLVQTAWRTTMGGFCHCKKCEGCFNQPGLPQL